MTAPVCPTTCRSCQAPIVWATTQAGKLIPLDPPVLAVIDDAGVMHKGRVSHFATCPNAAAHRKDGGR